ncbi:MAG: ComF family protein, partial [Lachnospiraceae bacterium]|nr:ComF family protein [Lachnospiraceae bacterium]
HQGDLPVKKKKLREALKQLLFPRRCPVCDGIVVPAGEKICIGCLPKLRPIGAPWCVICGKGLRRDGELCAEGEKGRTHAFRRARALYDYPSVAPSIYRFKYGGRREYGEFFGEEMATYLGDFIRETKAEGIIPIPLHKKRMRKRGYNQAGVLAKVLGKKLGLPTYENILFRVKNTAPLKEQNYKERQNNLKKAFLVRKNDVKLNTIILIDDIYTTGTTVDEATMALIEGGIKNVYVVTLAGSMEG